MKNQPIVNCHTHIFTAEDVPPLIAKTFVPFPFYYLTWFPAIFWLVKQYDKFKDGPLRKFRESRLKFLSLIKANIFYTILYNLFLTWAGLNAIYYILSWFGIPEFSTIIKSFFNGLMDYHILWPSAFILIKIAIILFVFLYSSLLRKALLLIGKWVWKPLTLLPKGETMEFVNRYLKIAAIAKYQKQSTAFQKLYKMYPSGSKFVALPMDMRYMGAGKPRSYMKQLSGINELMNSSSEIYKNLIPFLFVDPRRIRDPKGGENILDDKNKVIGHLPFFDYEFVNGKVVLKDSVMKKYLEVDPNDPTTGKFKGIKIYPALGYYPFDETLLPLWLYCVQRNLPITTHCTVGTIYYRGSVKKEWFTHPVFKYENAPLETYAKSNIELQVNFTQPLNYLVLLEPQALMTWLDKCSKATKELFGYDAAQKTLQRDLSALKINIAHFGGIAQWKRHLDKDRSNVAQEIMETPDAGISFFTEQGNPNAPKPFKPAWLWGTVDANWYALICSMMLQYKNVYADISYILHTPEINSLLNLTLRNEQLLKKVLFGTDYYVVRNHKSEKELYADIIKQFTDKQMTAMAIDNANEFLTIKD